MKLEYLSQTTLIEDVCSPIDFDSIIEHNKTITMFDRNIDEVSKEISINQITPTNNLRLLISGKLSSADAIKLSHLSKKYKKTRLVFSTKLEDFDSLVHFKELYGIQVRDFSPDHFTLLEKIPKSLKDISIDFSSSKSFSIETLKIFKDLKRLQIQGKVKDLNVISNFSKLEVADLGYMHIDNFSFLKNLKYLTRLCLRHGGVFDYSELENLSTLESIYIWKVRGLNDLNWLEDLANLKDIEIGALAQIHQLPSFEGIQKLEFIKLEQLKSLEKIDEISESESVKKIHISKMNDLDISTYESFIGHPNLIEITSGYSAKKKCKTITELLNLPVVTYEPFYISADF